MNSATTSIIAVLVPAHNEEENLPLSLPGAAAQVVPHNVYVVDDNGSDETALTALTCIPDVYSTRRGGKAAAVMAGIGHFRLLERYEDVPVLDADSRLMPDPIERYEEQLGEGVAAVIGHLRVLGFQRGPIAAWRRHLYFYMTLVYMRRAAFYSGGMPVTPGFCTVYATKALGRLDNEDNDPAVPIEDIDFCWQIHRKRLGKITYAPRPRGDRSAGEPQGLRKADVTRSARARSTPSASSTHGVTSKNYRKGAEDNVDQDITYGARCCTGEPERWHRDRDVEEER